MEEQLQLICDLCVKQHLTVATAESVTAGAIQALLSRATGASLFFQGGITVYNTGQKVKHLQVEPIHALSCNAVSERVAVEMSQGVCALFNSDIGISITGYAVPLPEEGINELFAFYAIVVNKEVVKKGKIVPRQKEMEKVVQEYAAHVIAACYDHLQQRITVHT